MNDVNDIIPILYDEHILMMEQIRDDSSIQSLLLQIASDSVRCFQSGGKILLFGCGGSAADAQHIAAEFINKFQSDRNPLPALALTTDSSVLTSIANDRDFNQIFSRQVKALIKKGDMIWGISTSGMSGSVLNGLIEGKKSGAITVLFTGSYDNIYESIDYAIRIPSMKTPRIQEAHGVVLHLLCDIIERRFL